MKAVKYRVTVEFTVPADDPHAAQIKLDVAKTIGEVVKVQASATKGE